MWAHGYTNPGPDRPPYTPLELPADEASGFRLKDIVRQLGTQEDGFYGYAATSYRRNGLVARDEGDHHEQSDERQGDEEPEDAQSSTAGNVAVTCAATQEYPEGDKYREDGNRHGAFLRPCER